MTFLVKLGWSIKIIYTNSSKITPVHLSVTEYTSEHCITFYIKVLLNYYLHIPDSFSCQVKFLSNSSSKLAQRLYFHTCVTKFYFTSTFGP